VAPEATRALVRAAVESIARAALQTRAPGGSVLAYGPEGYQAPALLCEAAVGLDGWEPADVAATEPAAFEPLGRLRLELVHSSGRRILLAAAEAPDAEAARELAGLGAANPLLHAAVQIPPLTADDAREVASQLLANPLPGRVARRFVADADGNPELVAQLISAYRPELELGAGPGLGALDRGGRVPLLRSQRAALATASSGARTAAEIVAVLRTASPVSVVGRIAAWLGITELFGAFDLDEAMRLGLVRAVEGAAVPTVAPPSGVAADHIAATIPLARRREIHSAAADLVTGLAALQHRVGAVENDDTTLVADLLRAARAHAAAHDAEAAMGLALMGVRLAVTVDGEYERAMLTLGMLALELHEHSGIVHLFDEFAALPESGRRELILADLECLAGRAEAAGVRARTLVERAGAGSDDRAMRAHAAVMRPMYAVIASRHELVFDLTAKARAVLARTAVDPDDVSPDLRWSVRPAEHELLLTAWELVAAARGRDEARVTARMGRLDRLVRAAPDSAAVIDAVVFQARTQAYAGRIAEAQQRIQRAVPLFGEYRGSWLTGAGLALHAHLLFLTGEWDAARTAAQRAVDAALDGSHHGALPTAHAITGLAPAIRGDAAEVERIDRLIRLVPRSGPDSDAYSPDLPDLMRAELAAALGDPAAQLAATSGAHAARRPGSRWGWLQLHVDALLALGRLDEAGTVAAQALGGTTPWNRSPGNIMRMEAHLAAARGDMRLAVDRFTALVRSPFGAALPFERARDRLDFARALLGVSRDEAAREQLALAVPVFERLETGPYLDRARELAETIEARRAAAATRTEVEARHPADPLARLTERERQVAVAAADGLTNREIAAQLFISVTTVNFHVRNILSKLSLDSRRGLRALVTRPRDQA